MEDLHQEADAIRDELTELRRDLHRWPELGFKEFKTADKVAECLSGFGLDVTTGIGGTGVIGLLRGGRPGPTIALRACLDALPIVERSGVEYASLHSGAMHACGHDGNMTIVLGAAKILSRRNDLLCGNVKFIFQPSEEETGGAAEIIRCGGLKNPDVDAIVTPHNWHGLKQGVLAVVPGSVLASCDIFHLKIIGKPGHGAWPHMAVDPVVVAADIITALQNIVSREIDPLESATITIGMIHGGTAVNIIPESVTISGTTRALKPEIREFLRARILETASGVAQAARAECEPNYIPVMPPVNNDRRLTEQIGAILRNAFGPEMISDGFQPGMGCEEFALFQEHVPGFFLFIGNDTPGNEPVALHAPDYIFNDEILTVGVKALCEIVLSFAG